MFTRAIGLALFLAIYAAVTWLATAVAHRARPRR